MQGKCLSLKRFLSYNLAIDLRAYTCYIYLRRSGSHGYTSYY